MQSTCPDSAAGEKLRGEPQIAHQPVERVLLLPPCEAQHGGGMNGHDDGRPRAPLENLAAQRADSCLRADDGARGGRSRTHHERGGERHKLAPEGRAASAA